jgi:hypothetical protein
VRARRVKDDHDGEGDEKMQSQTENGRRGPAFKCLPTEQTAGDELQKPRGSGSSPERDDDGRNNIHRADDQTGYGNGSDGRSHPATLGSKRFA